MSFAYNTTYAFCCSSSMPPPAGALATGGPNNGGGMCTIGSSGCASTAGVGKTALTLSAGGSGGTPGSLTITIPGTSSQTYEIVITLTQYSPSGKGDIYNLIFGGSSIGVTSVVAYNSGGSGGTFVVTGLTGGSAHTLAIADLFQQWMGCTSYTLPGYLGNASLNYSGGISASYDTVSLGTISIAATQTGSSVTGTGQFAGQII